jgi:hypothetical protein
LGAILNHALLLVLQSNFREDVHCKVQCKVVLDKKQAKKLKSKISDEYRGNL